MTQFLVKLSLAEGRLRCPVHSLTQSLSYQPSTEVFSYGSKVPSRTLMVKIISIGWLFCTALQLELYWNSY